jgi:hypothetical protein
MPDAGVNWGSVADWVSGIGSLSAGIIALYLAKANTRIRLRGYCGMRVIIGQGIGPKQLISISVTNVGTRSTVVNNITMRVGRFRRKRFAVITVVKDAYSVGVPFTLADGQEGYWRIPLDENKTWLKDLCKGFVNSPSDVQTLRFSVHTNHGDVLILKPEENLKSEILALLSHTDA